MSSVELMKPKSLDNLEDIKDISNYIYEIKFDGGSSRIVKDSDNITIFHNKNPNPQNMKYPDLISDINQNVKNGSYVVELCVFDERGISNFKHFVKRANLSNRIKINFVKDIFPIVAVFHDIIKDDNTDVTSHTLMERKKLLDKNVKTSKHIQISKIYEKPDEILKQKDVLEGIVIKKRESPYLFAKRDNWYKFRFNKEETVKCVDFEDTDTGIVLITEDGKRINCAGKERSQIARHKLLNGGCIECEISYHERTANGYRFTTLKRIVGEE